jgi:competence protein ComK
VIGLKPRIILESWANAYGIGISGSREAFKSTQSARQKLPVLVDPFRQIYFFPTQSPKQSTCLWINAAQIRTVKPDGLGTRITFIDDSELTLLVGPRSIKRQLSRVNTMRQAICSRILAEGLMNPIHP